MFIPVAIYTTDAEFIGYGIMGEHKLQSTNIYKEDEQDQLHEQLARLNADIDIRKFWPHPQDSDVQALVNDPEFAPIEYVTTKVVDEENSYYKFKQKPSRDPETEKLIMIDSDEIDEEASVLVFKEIKVPAKPTDVMWRIKQASERVARERAGLLD